MTSTLTRREFIGMGLSIGLGLSAGSCISLFDHSASQKVTIYCHCRHLRLVPFATRLRVLPLCGSG